MRRNLLIVVVAMTASLPGIGSAQSAIDGTWKVDIASYSQPKKPVTYVLKDGVFSCASCPGQASIQADGRDHSVEGDSSRDTMSVKVRDARTLETISKKAGKVVSKVRMHVAADGKTMTRHSTDTNNGRSSVEENSYTRVATGPAGAHWLSGSWRRTQIKKATASLVTFKTSGDTLTMSSPHGGSYTAKLGGPPAPVAGDSAASTVTVVMKDANTMEETTHHNGKLFIVTTMQVEPDGKKARVSWKHPEGRGWEMRYMFVPDADGPTGSYTMTRQ